ncbi:uncharacterized protein LOC116619582 [Nematostella vectensis]|uniref:uncharacterized protein LOC116619582 n=1 Tax=Nematostella vectensis TaxID=45351 RepID=UPI002076E891|nr:uncharacterized protein LOC116619582 [Nematostella vectensis]
MARVSTHIAMFVVMYLATTQVVVESFTQGFLHFRATAPPVKKQANDTPYREEFSWRMALLRDMARDEKREETAETAGRQSDTREAQDISTTQQLCAMLEAQCTTTRLRRKVRLQQARRDFCAEFEILCQQR